MAWRLNDLVICGELLNTRKNSVHGWLGLRGHERPLVFQLTGNCDPDLRGRHIRFETRPSRQQDDDAENAERDENALANLAWQQIGPTGTITAARKVKVTDCSTRELYMRCKAGEPPPFQWKRCLYLEWFSQNGRVVVELVDPIIEFVEADATPAPDEPPEGAEGEEPPEAPGSGLSVTAIQLGEDGDAEIRDLSPADLDAEDEPPEDPYGLFSDELRQQFDRDAADTDRALDGDGDGDDEEAERALRETELMDDLLEHNPGEPIRAFVDVHTDLPPPERLDEQQAETAVKTLLGRLALFGIALDICPHFTWLDAYRLLLERICTEHRAYRELKDTQWVQQFMTSEFCEQCKADAERAYEAEKRQRTEGPGEDPPSDGLPHAGR